MAVIKMNFLSQALGMQTNVTICLPSYSFADRMSGREEVYVPGMKYQVLWLLHGGSGDDSDYLHFSNITRYADNNKIAVVMPADYNAAYTDDLDGGAKYFTYVAEELPKMCRALFPFSDKREDNFVGGLSMGSHGAMKVGMNYPEQYAGMLIMSGCSYRPGVPMNVPAKNGVFDLDAPARPLNKVMSYLHDAEQIKGTVDDIYTIAAENVKQGKLLPKIYMRVGLDDHALYRARKARESLSEMGYDIAQYEEVPGMGHEWDLWDETLRLALNEWLPIRHSAIYPGEE